MPQIPMTKIHVWYKIETNSEYEDMYSLYSAAARNLKRGDVVAFRSGLLPTALPVALSGLYRREVLYYFICKPLFYRKLKDILA